MTHPVDVLWTGASEPAYAHPGDAGADLVSTEAFELAPGERRLVGTGLRIALPEGFAAFVVPRSGLAAKHGITIVNAPGTVDAGYRGEIKVALLNTDRTEPYAVSAGDRIAQLIVMPVPVVRFVQVDALPESVRGIGGFGSSGYRTEHVVPASGSAESISVPGSHAAESEEGTQR
ncbi:dUTP diphosphatase [Curtobacterium ammoniigenes]|uniref:dUTP diphosphatase n=1 Tax=Curtobacterium ammoniigenes TaxID=395387 RepID=UPI000835C801|nr:dUTP diphosphatase [Curtobacterium ammoniigenes]